MTRRPTATRIVRTAVGVVGVAAAAATVLLAGRLDLPAIGTQPASVTVTPVAADQSRVCAGGLLELGQDAAAATAAASLGAPDLVAAVGTDGGADASSLAAPDDAAGGAGPALLTAPPSDDAWTLAGAQSQTVGSERAAGLAAAACTEASSDAWLVGGSSDVGQSSLVAVANPSSVEAVVTLEVYGENGRVDAPGAADIVVPPGTQRVFPLAGIAPDVVVPVVRVTSVGAAVAATIQQSAVRSITPEGADIVGATAAPGDRQTIPGFLVPSDRPVDRADGYDYRVPGVRLLVPGDFDGEATVTALAADGTASDPLTVSASAGEVIEVPLDGLEPGRYTLVVASDRPLVAAAHAAADRDEVTDFAWFAAAVPLDDAATVAVAAAPTPLLTIANPTGEERVVTVASTAGSEEVSVPAGGAVAVPVGSRRVYELSGTEGLVASVRILEDGGFASYTVAPPGAASDPVVVRTR